MPAFLGRHGVLLGMMCSVSQSLMPTYHLQRYWTIDWRGKMSYMLPSISDF